MKVIPSLFFILLTFTCFAGEKPELIPLKIKAIRPVEWYAHQADLWRETVLSTPSAEAWLNYYTAAKYAQWDAGQLNTIASNVEKLSPGSFESYVIRSWQLGYSDEAFDMMQKAFDLKPDHPATYSSLVLQHEFHAQPEKRKDFSEKLWKSGQVANSLLSYSYNVLMSVENNAILFTEGDNTTIPIFILQDIFNIRTDVHVLNLDMMLDPVYREKKLVSTGLNLESFVSVADEYGNKSSLCGLLPQQNPGQKFYYSLTLSKKNTDEIKDQLYVVGLASQISTTRLDNITSLKENLENRFLLDHLTVNFEGEGAYASGRILSANYLVPMLLLSEHYMKTGESEKLKRWEVLIEKLAHEHGKSLVVQNFLNRDKLQPAPFVPADLNVKALEGSLRQIRGNIYAFKNELTNDDYNFFLKYLSDNKQSDIYERSNIDLSQYAEPALSLMRGYHTRPLSKKEKAGYPIINISYEGAIAYCEWLTEQYNQDEKRKYKKVKFRLPSINEWQIAALGYKKFQSWKIEENTIEIAIPKNDTDELCKNCPVKAYKFEDSDILYPWFGSFNYRNKALNMRGCSLGNFKWPEAFKTCLPNLPAADGWIAMAPVETYFPNDMGLYDVVGNVAEMTNEKGKACGGSWNHPPEESTITSINEYKGPDAAIGVRVFMEVIEQ